MILRARFIKYSIFGKFEDSRVRKQAVMNRLIVSLGIILLSIVLTVAQQHPPTVPTSDSLPELPFARELAEALDHALQSGQGEHNLGISVAVIVPGYALWTGTSGDSQPGVPITADMLFDAGSVMKNFEAVLALKLAEEGLFDLDDPLSDWLPEYHNVDGTITIRQLLNHTSGVFNVFEHPEFPWVGADVDYAKDWSMAEVFESFVDTPYGQPETVQHYSSTNYLLLTAIIQRTGVDIPERIEWDLLSPLNLEHTVISMGEPLPAQFTGAHPWVDVDGDGTLDDLFGAPVTWKVSLTHPVLFTTAGDLARWMQALYHDRTVLSVESLDAMLTFPENVLPDPEGGQYGLGVVDYSDILGIEVIGHGGSALGFSAAALYLPNYGASLVWLINTGESPAALANTLMGETWFALSDVLREHLEPSP